MHTIKHVILPIALMGGAAFLTAQAPRPQAPPSTDNNRQERLERFRDFGFGMFIHWTVDGQLGGVISHHMVGADEDFLKRYVEDLPKTFNPRKFYPQDWAALAKLAGMKYVMFTTKHHNGFCMFKTATTDFNVMNTPFRRDITAEVFSAFREQGIATGVYFSPDDFWWLRKNGKTLQRGIPDVQPANNPGLMAHDQAQLRELLTNYGPIDYIFFDGEPQGLKELAWQLQPDIVVTRGQLQTPEQYVPGTPLEGAWESNLTMGTEWPYKPTNETYKSGGELISLLIETRAKGGNLLLNVGPKPDGELPIEQEDRLREVALWMFVNNECIYGVRPWVITNEGDTWFTKKKDEDTVYAIIKSKEPWPFATTRDFVLKSVRSTPNTSVSVLGHNGKVVEYQPRVNPAAVFHQEADGLHVRAMFAQRLYTNRRWPNPVVFKITNVKPALVPPRVQTGRATWDAASRVATFQGELLGLGDATSVEVGFEYRSIQGMDRSERTNVWTPAAFERKTATGPFSIAVKGLNSGEPYEFRATVKHPLITTYGGELTFTPGAQTGGRGQR
ncbi:MAG: alpha-L-fucosidase [Candidatus Solibacter sp.]